MKKAAYSLVALFLVFVGFNSANAAVDCEKCKQCAAFTGSAYTECVTTNCEGDIQSCKKELCSMCKTGDNDCYCNYCEGARNCDQGETTNKPDIDESGSYPKLVCGDVKIPLVIPKLTSFLVTLIQIVVPILIIIFGSIDLVKAVMAQKEDEIKKGQHTFVKRLIAGCLVFFIVLVVKMAIGVVAPHDASNATMWDCVDYFISGVK